jgi:uncharacterized protein DUF6284
MRTRELLAMSKRDEPTRADLRRIEDEWPLIEAELAVVDAEIAAARLGDDMSELGRRRVRRAQARLTTQMVESTRRAGDLDGDLGGAA